MDQKIFNQNKKTYQRLISRKYGIMGGANKWCPIVRSPAYQTGKLSAIYQTFEDDYGIDINQDFDGDSRENLLNLGAF